MGCCLDDGAVRIFLNTRGTDKDTVSAELIEFLHYVEHTTDEVAEHSSSERIKRIHQRVQMVKISEEAGVRYMQAWEEKYYERQDGLEEGLARGRQEGLKEGIKALIHVCMEENFDKEKILGKLTKRFELSRQDAEQYYTQYSSGDTK